MNDFVSAKKIFDLVQCHLLLNKEFHLLTMWFSGVGTRGIATVEQAE